MSEVGEESWENNHRLENHTITAATKLAHHMIVTVRQLLYVISWNVSHARVIISPMPQREGLIRSSVKNPIRALGQSVNHAGPCTYASVCFISAAKNIRLIFKMIVP
jgi:hypothetical protein